MAKPLGAGAAGGEVKDLESLPAITQEHNGRGCYLGIDTTPNDPMDIWDDCCHARQEFLGPHPEPFAQKLPRDGPRDSAASFLQRADQLTIDA